MEDSAPVRLRIRFAPKSNLDKKFGGGLSIDLFTQEAAAATISASLNGKEAALHPSLERAQSKSNPGVGCTVFLAALFDWKPESGRQLRRMGYSVVDDEVVAFAAVQKQQGILAVTAGCGKGSGESTSQQENRAIGRAVAEGLTQIPRVAEGENHGRLYAFSKSKTNRDEVAPAWCVMLALVVAQAYLRLDPSTKHLAEDSTGLRRRIQV